MVREVTGGVTFATRVQPGANEALISFLSGLLEVPRTSVMILSGDQSRSKVIRVDGLSSSAVEAAFSPELC